MKTARHVVTVTHDVRSTATATTVTFTCDGDRHSSCHEYTDPENHFFGPLQHDTCVLQDWFTQPAAEVAAAYLPRDGRSRKPHELPTHSGPIIESWHAGGFSWRWEDLEDE